VLIACSGFLWGPKIRKRMELLYIQHQCMTHTAPPSQIIFTDDPAVMAKLSDSGYRKALPKGPFGVARNLPEGQAFYGAPAGPEFCGTIFCHRLRSPAGHERLVGVELLFDDPGPSLMTDASVIDPASLFTLPNGAVSPHAPVFEADFQGLGVGTFFAGQLDPADASHFTFVYRYRDQDTIVDGWLNDDDSVPIQERRPGSPPTRPPRRPLR
jgi:hypothetical protein